MTEYLPFFILVILAYLLGSTSSAIIVSKILNLPDPRTEGSKNPGATNVLRLGGKKAAAVVLIFDILKAFVPMLIGHFMHMPINQIATIGVASILGHVFPIYYGFEGGKGVATALGLYFGLNGWFGLMCIAIWLITLTACRYSSLSSLTTVITAPLLAIFFFGSIWIAIPLLLVALLVAWRHQENIQRLYQGTESQTSLFSRASRN